MTQLCAEFVDSNRLKIVDCNTGQEVDICSMCGTIKGSRKKRAPSAYNIFIGKCMKGGKNMKQCAADYKRSK